MLTILLVSLLGLLVWAGEGGSISGGVAEGYHNKVPTFSSGVGYKQGSMYPALTFKDSISDSHRKLLITATRIGRGRKTMLEAQKYRAFLERKGSPMAPTTEELVMICNNYNISPELIIGIAGVESSYGRRCYGHNPFGYLKAGAGTGLRTYASWTDGYIALCKFIRSHWRADRFTHSSQLPGYCVPNHPWMEKVERMKP